MTITAQAWKTTMEKGTDQCVYRMQVNGVDGKSEKRIARVLEGWKDAGDGYNPRTGAITLFFSRDFGTTEAWLEWAKSFGDWNLVELDKHGEVKKYVRCGSRSKAKKKSVGRQCGKCGEYGHNARTCGTKPNATLCGVKKARKKRVEKGPRKCGKCGQAGHNARTCPSK